MLFTAGSSAPAVGLSAARSSDSKVAKTGTVKSEKYVSLPLIFLFF